MRAIIKTGLIGIFCVFIQSMSAQYFSKRYPLTTSGYISSLQIVDDTIYAMCEVADTVPPFLSIGDFVKFDKYGTLLSETFFRIPGKSIIGANKNNLIKTQDGGFAYGGWTAGTAGTDWSLFIAKYDRHGSLEWFRDMPDTNYLAMYSLAFSQDRFSNFYFVGSVSEKLTYKLKSYIVKADSSGSQIYKRILPDYGYAYCTASGVCFNSKNNVVLSTDGSNTDVNNYTTAESHLIMFELDTAGNILKHMIDSNVLGPSGGAVICLDNDQYLTVGGYCCLKSLTKYYFKGAITKLDSNFNVIWEIDTGFCSDANTGLYSLLPLPNGDILAAGVSRDINDTLSNHINGWAVRFDKAGHLLLNRLYRGVSNFSQSGDYNLLYTSGLFSDGSIMLGGESTNHGVTLHSQQAWLLHLDTAVCLPDSNSCGIVNSILGIPTVSAAIRVYPNPSSTTITVECILSEPEASHLTIYDQLGQSIYERDIAMQEKNIEINVRQWPAAFYTYRLTSASSYSVGGSFIVGH